MASLATQPYKHFLQLYWTIRVKIDINILIRTTRTKSQPIDRGGSKSSSNRKHTTQTEGGLPSVQTVPLRTSHLGFTANCILYSFKAENNSFCFSPPWVPNLASPILTTLPPRSRVPASPRPHIPRPKVPNCKSPRPHLSASSRPYFPPYTRSYVPGLASPSPASQTRRLVPTFLTHF